MKRGSILALPLVSCTAAAPANSPTPLPMAYVPRVAERGEVHAFVTSGGAGAEVRCFVLYGGDNRPVSISCTR